MKLSKHRKPIFAADEGFEGRPMFDDEAFGIDDEEGAGDEALEGDELEDEIEQEEYEEDDPSIEIDNNIENHYIAECESCHGIFISAVILSDQPVETLTGVCPLCGKDTDQSLKWVIKSIEDVEEE